MQWYEGYLSESPTCFDLLSFQDLGRALYALSQLQGLTLTETLALFMTRRKVGEEDSFPTWPDSPLGSHQGCSGGAPE